jgi:CRP/FNR family transcriptional regulator, cyclic AMP receptor protein
VPRRASSVDPYEPGPSQERNQERSEERGQERGKTEPGTEEEQQVAAPSVADNLANVPIFSGCSKRELGIIARASKEVSHKQGTVIAREGERGIGLFLILDGQCKVTIGGKTKARLGPGDFFGEVALLDGGPRTATVTALSPVRLVGITGWVFRGLLMEHPTIALKTLEAVAGRLRSVSKEPV